MPLRIFCTIDHTFVVEKKTVSFSTEPLDDPIRIKNIWKKADML